MPRPKKDSSAALAIPNNPATLVNAVHPDNPRIMKDGEAHPQWTWRNIKDYGYLCPRREYIESAEVISLKRLGEKWNVGQRDIEHWRTQKDWEVARLREWQSAAVANWKEEAGALQSYQKKEIESQRSRWHTLRQITEEMLAKGTVPEQTATGIIYDRELSLKELKDAAAILVTCDEQIARTIGMGKMQIRAMAANDKDDTGEIVETRVRKVRHNYTVEITEEKPVEVTKLPELPEISKEYDYEGEVVDADSSSTSNALSVFDAVSDDMFQ